MRCNRRLSFANKEAESGPNFGEAMKPVRRLVCREVADTPSRDLPAAGAARQGVPGGIFGVRGGLEAALLGVDGCGTGGAGDSRRAGNDQVLGITEGDVEDVSRGHCKVRLLAFLDVSERDLCLCMICFVDEPSVADTISILRGIKEKYELHHGVRISDAALVAAATLSNRYITDRFLPDKAIDLMDEAGSRLRMQVDSKP